MENTEPNIYNLLKANFKLKYELEQAQELILNARSVKTNYSKEESCLLLKIQKAKQSLLRSNIKMTGKNNYNNYNYFELKDITPQIVDSLLEQGLSSHFFVIENVMHLIINDSESGAYFEWTCPLKRVETVNKNNKGDTGKYMKEEQALRTYARRTLWLEALDIVEPNYIEKETDIKKDTVNTNLYTIPTDAPENVQKVLKQIERTFKQYNVVFDVERINNKLDSMYKNKTINHDDLQEVRKYL